MLPPRQRQSGESAFGYGLLLFSLFVFHQAYVISGFRGLSTAGAVPMAAAAVMIVCAALVVVDNHRHARRAAPETATPTRRVLPRDILVFTGLIGLFTLALEPLGFIVSAFVFLLASIHYLHRGSALFTLAVSAGALAVVYVVFRLLFLVVLPEGSLFR